MNENGAGLLLGFVVFAAVLGGGVMAGAAWIVNMGAPTVGIGEAIVATVVHGNGPSEAWGISGSDTAYWAVLAGLLVVVMMFMGVLIRLVVRKRWGTKRRQRLGSNTETRLATAKDLETLWIDWNPGGRFLLGRTHGRLGTKIGSKLLGSEWRADPTSRRLSSAARRRKSDRGAVMIVGPSRSGKTVTALTGVRLWHGPVVLSSVKGDLLEPTLAHRRRLGEVGVFDPTRYLLNAYASGNGPSAWDERLRVGWSPLRATETYVGAARAARGLADAGPEPTGGQNAMWVKLAEQLLQGLMYVAKGHRLGMREVVRWVAEQDRPKQDGEGAVFGLLEDLIKHGDPNMVDDAHAAFDALNGVWSQDPKIVSSVYTTAMSLVESWIAPAVADSTEGTSVNLDWLCSGLNSLYLVAPPQDAKRMAPVFGGLVNDLLEQCFAKVARDGKPIDPPLLIVLDEAGNLPLARLPEFASTVAGLGVQLVTVWQAMSQIKSLYRDDADTVITNHLTKVIYPGLSDEGSLDYLEKLTGDEEVETILNTDDKWRFWAGSMQLQGTRLGLTPKHVIRTMPTGESLLVHGQLLPAHIKSVPWFEQKQLVAGLEWDGSDDGLPRSLNIDPDLGDYWDEALERAARTRHEGTVAERPTMAEQLGIGVEIVDAGNE